VEELRRVLEDSVAAHLVADVPISTFLSGGLDSSLLTVLAARRDRDIDCYTISFRPEDRRLEAMPDDLAYARKIAARHGLPLHEVEIAPDVADLLPRMVQALDEPIGDAAAINAYLICRAARDAGVKVLLSGMGADELFAGYRKHYAALLAARYRRLPGVVRSRVVAPAVERLPVAGRRRGYRSARWAKRFVAFADLPEEAAFRRSYTHYDVDELHELLDPELWPRVDQLVEEHAAVYAEGPADDQVNRMCYADTRLFLTGLNLAYTDRASMAASTEVRVPYVDKEVAAAAFAIPGRAKIVGRERKAILKQAAEAWLPREIVYRPKGLFSAPLRAWIRRDLADMVEDLVAGGKLVTSGLLDKQMVRTMIDDDRRGAADRSKEIWQLLTLEVWYAQQGGER
jgi:asparagine synthase (glutamine-hydrolysing)